MLQLLNFLNGTISEHLRDTLSNNIFAFISFISELRYITREQCTRTVLFYISIEIPSQSYNLMFCPQIFFLLRSLEEIAQEKPTYISYKTVVGDFV